MDRLSATVNRLFAQDKWAEAQALLERALSEDPQDHWLLSRLSAALYEQRKYKKALDYARRAHDLAPDCPLVLWDLAGALDATGKAKEAANIYARLLRRGAARVAADECGEGAAWARSLLTDCLYRLALYFEKRRPAKARRCLQRYVTLRLLGVDSIYDLVDAQSRLRKLAGPNGRSAGRELDEAGREIPEAV